MNSTAREIFIRIVGSQPLVWDPKYVPWEGSTPGGSRERTDAEFDALVAYAVRAAAAIRREEERFAAANPVPRPAPTSIPPGPAPFKPSFVERGASVKFAWNQSPGFYEADAHEVRPSPGLNGFRWFVVALSYPLSKSGSPGEPPIFFGTPKRRTVAGPFKTRAEAENLLAAVTGAPR